MQADAIRTWLWVPADAPRTIERSRSCGSDALLLDLEEGTAPQFKDRGREISQQELRKGGFNAAQK